MDTENSDRARFTEEKTPVWCYILFGLLVTLIPFLPALAGG